MYLVGRAPLDGLLLLKPPNAPNKRVKQSSRVAQEVQPWAPEAAEAGEK